ncbi:MAG: hypothetical protein AAFU61_11645, partial [Pseudomonadota bacterium]
LRDAAGYSAAAAARIEGWRARLEAVRAGGGTAAIWGSGSKCVAFLHALGRDGPDDVPVEAIVDVNPHRAGKVAPGLGTPISRPEALVALAPELIVAMNAIYLEEIRADCARMGLRAEVVALGEAPEGVRGAA